MPVVGPSVHPFASIANSDRPTRLVIIAHVDLSIASFHVPSHSWGVLMVAIIAFRSLSFPVAREE
jgi:hypothetical protein